ncbi:PLP-dependent aminotransferase family protein [Bacillus sp. 03113]|uniref:MocR-like pyridoxine biosynthesis transcription factor PdxR n=1 Tax=Bacillus sp. 03113 TaxID=2578211 RepID=UPI001141857F|nr:PLP-dependent aminotransferase family protein [Bacillus sp. 03113]
MYGITIDRSLEVPLIKQVYQQIREQILHGVLQAGEKLPSTRELSSDLSVSRNVIVEVYEQLLAEGFLEAKKGSGTYVAEGTYLEQNISTLFDNRSISDVTEKNKNLIHFRSGIPALELFPRKTWSRLSQALWNEVSPSLLGYDIPEGRPELRTSLASYLRKTRGVHCHPEQIIITSGSVQAFTIISRLLLSQGDKVIIEDPITKDIGEIFKETGSSLYPIPVDRDGMKTSLLPLNINPKFVFLTPSHQFPLGGSLPIQRRIQLIHFARKMNCYLVEDDYDSEFRYEGPPISSLQGLDPDHVIYVGSFSKILLPSLRLGYLVLPTQLVEKSRRIKWISDLHNPSFEQLVLARFIGEGHLERHIFKMKKVYNNRRDCLIQCLKRAFPNKITLFGYSTGLHLVVEFNDVEFSKEVLELIQFSGVKVHPVESHSIQKGNHLNQVIIGYGHLTEEEISEGVNRLKKALEIIGK